MDEKKSWYEEILKFFYLIRNHYIEEEFEVDYQAKKERGKIQFYWVNKNFYTYQILFVFFTLVFASFYFYQQSHKHKKEIIKNLNEIQRLKLQQDGDYFLTSLLTRSIQVIEINSELYDIKYYVKQKKSFFYKKRHYEIGGDYVLIKPLVIQQKSFIAI
ncbi:MAG: hypothetical protein NZ853_02530 [Leptospiraceae bacterium]|nr:hypothetical protein [Leptospiraceae bacterium]MDW7975056.1 hypothetical protein [Leptospiraceae bacterium]